MGFPGIPKLPNRLLNIYTFPNDTVIPIVLSNDEYDLIINPSYLFERDLFGNITKLWIIGYSLVTKQEVRYYKEYIRDSFGRLIYISGWKKP